MKIRLKYQLGYIIVSVLILSSCIRNRSLNSYSSAQRINASKELESFVYNSVDDIGRKEIKNVKDKSTNSYSAQAVSIKKSRKTIAQLRESSFENTKNSNEENKFIKPSKIKQDWPKINNRKATDGFIFTMIGLFLPIPIINFVLLMVGFGKGIAALNEFKAFPGKYKGRGFAIAAVSIGAFVLLALFIALMLLLTIV